MVPVLVLGGILNSGFLWSIKSAKRENSRKPMRDKISSGKSADCGCQNQQLAKSSREKVTKSSEKVVKSSGKISKG